MKTSFNIVMEITKITNLDTKLPEALVSINYTRGNPQGACAISCP